MEPPSVLTGTEMGLEPQIRARSNTWPLPRPDNYVENDNSVEMAEQKCGSIVAALPGGGVPVNTPQGGTHLKKNSSRRNAWGNLSYADLITQAIASAPEKRLTLSQIYEWMVQNVAYFKDKGDSNSSAGWKNSIRHNLSLHNRFMRVQNEGTGKSSWWMINPDAKPGKSARRRATSMETPKFEKRRGRVKKKVEALRSGLEATPSPSSSVSESLDIFPESPPYGFQLSPDFRPRTSSNASSCGGRLSPIPAADGDWYYNQEQLAGNLEQTMRLGQQQQQAQPQPQPQPPPQQQQQPQPQPQSQPPPQQRALTTSVVPGTPQDLPPSGGFVYPPPPPYRPAPPYMAPCPVHRLPHPCHACAVAPKQKLFVGESESAATMMGQLMGALNPTTMLDEVNINIETIPAHGFDCNVDEVIKHELSLDGTLDFNFTGGGNNGGGGGGSGVAPGDAGVLPTGQTQEAATQPYSGHSWVH